MWFGRLLSGDHYICGYICGGEFWKITGKASTVTSGDIPLHSQMLGVVNFHGVTISIFFHFGFLSEFPTKAIMISPSHFHYHHNTKSKLIFDHLTLLSIIEHYLSSAFHSTHEETFLPAMACGYILQSDGNREQVTKCTFPENLKKPFWSRPFVHIR